MHGKNTVLSIEIANITVIGINLLASTPIYIIETNILYIISINQVLVLVTLLVESRFTPITAMLAISIDTITGEIHYTRET